MQCGADFGPLRPTTVFNVAHTNGETNVSAMIKTNKEK